MTGRFRSLADPASLRLFVQNVGEGIYITTRAGEILDANPAFLEMLGIGSLEELAGYHAGDLLADPSQRERELELLERDGAVREFELELIRPDGERRTVLDTTYVCRDPDRGEPVYHGILVDITRRKMLETQLVEMSRRDALTGCFNRRYLADTGARLEARPGAAWGCIYVDIDRFKQYNDRHGHQAGDDVLVEMSRFLLREVRAQEAVVRIGGDEFLIVFEGPGSHRVEKVARRLQLAALRGAPAPFSIGWAERQNGEPFEKTIDRADRHLLAARVLERTPDTLRREADRD